MKTMSAFFLTIALSLPSLLFAQSRQYPDSIRIELPEHGAIAIFELKVFAKDKDIIRNFPDRLGEIASHIRKSIPESQWDDAHSVEVVSDKTHDKANTSRITLTRLEEDVTRLRVQGSTVLELLPPGWKVTIGTARAVAHLYAPDLNAIEAISKISFDPVLEHLETNGTFVNQKRMGVFTRVVMENERVTPANTGHRLPADMLGLHAGAGVGIAGDRIYPEFNGMVALYFANRFQSSRQRIAAGYELKLFSGRSEQNSFYYKPASFVTLSYGINFNSKRPRWTAIGVGYLIHNRSDLFSDKTLKISLESDIGSDKLNIIPELYLTDDFKKSIFGMKLNYRF